VKLRKAGKRTVRMRLSRRAAAILRHRHASFRVTYRGAGRSGVARIR
jgi:hypothetical protein